MHSTSKHLNPIIIPRLENVKEDIGRKDVKDNQGLKIPNSAYSALDVF